MGFDLRIHKAATAFWSPYFFLFACVFSVLHSWEWCPGFPVSSLCMEHLPSPLSCQEVHQWASPPSLALRKQLHKEWKCIPLAGKGGGSCWKARQKAMIHPRVPNKVPWDANIYLLILNLTRSRNLGLVWWELIKLAYGHEEIMHIVTEKPIDFSTKTQILNILSTSLHPIHTTKNYLRNTAILMSQLVF